VRTVLALGTSRGRCRSLRALAAVSALALLVPALAARAAAPAAPPPELTFATLPDGVQLALRLVFPAGFNPQDERHQWPALFNMDGYGGAGEHNDDEFDIAPTRRYVLVYASVRGTGCSGGQFRLFSHQTALDGKWIVDHWIPAQPWSNGEVGIFGHSYSGLTGLAVAETRPSHLAAVAVSGLIGDLYRDILYMGGIPNPGFPLLWGQVLRPGEELEGNVTTLADSARCRANFAQHDGSDLVVPPQTLAAIYGNPYATAGSWAELHSLIDGIGRIDRPIWIAQQYEDEQTGPRGGLVLWLRLPPGVPSRLLMTNGLHTTNHLFNGDRLYWFDCFMLDHGKHCHGGINDPQGRVELFFDTTGPGTSWQQDHLNPPLAAPSFPLPDTDWTTEYLLADHTLAPSPQGGQGTVSYLATTAGRQMTADFGFDLGNNGAGRATFVPGPDQALYALRFARPTAIAGPLELTLYASVSAPDTDFFVDLLDVNPANGDTTYLQRGLLRASLRLEQNQYALRIPSGPDAGEIYWPFHAYVRSQPLSPGRVYRFDIEINPIAHVFPAGHELVLDIHAPPPSDPLSTYVWASGRPPSVVTIYQEPKLRSRVLLPLLPSLPPVPAKAPACGTLTGEPCFQVLYGMG
jgi:predicted acyl esterase